MATKDKRLFSNPLDAITITTKGIAMKDYTELKKAALDADKAGWYCVSNGFESPELKAFTLRANPQTILTMLSANEQLRAKLDKAEDELEKVTGSDALGWDTANCMQDERNALQAKLEDIGTLPDEWDKHTFKCDVPVDEQDFYVAEDCSAQLREKL